MKTATNHNRMEVVDDTKDQRNRGSDFDRQRVFAMKNDPGQVVWMFRFGMEREDGQKFGGEAPEALLTHILDWAEEHGYQIGGGYRPPTDEESRIGDR